MTGTAMGSVNIQVWHPTNAYLPVKCAVATGQMMATPKNAPQGVLQQIFVLGDSHADALFPVFEELSTQAASPIFIYANAGCSFIDFRTPMNQSNQPIVMLHRLMQE